MNAIVARFLSSGILLVWGVVLVSFQITGRLDSYLHPAFHVFTTVSGVVLVLLACALLLTRPSGLGSSQPPRLAAAIASAFVLTVPMLAAVVISPSEFGAAIVRNRGLIEDISSLPSYIPPMEPALPTEDGSIGAETPIDAAAYLSRNEKGQIRAETVDLLYAAAEPAIRQDFEDKEIEIIGQFVPARTGNSSGDRFNLIRMFVMCCAADARPVAVLVQTKPGTSFPEMTWLRVTGKATFPLEGGRRVALVIADDIEEIGAPDETFIY